MTATQDVPALLRAVEDIAETADVYERHEDATTLRALAALVEQQQAETKRLRELLANLEGAATRVSNCGAVTGPQWTRLSSALISARAALREGESHE